MSTHHEREEATMYYNIQEQIENWRAKESYYTNRKEVLKKRLQNLEDRRESINTLPVGNPTIDRFYRRLSNLYTQYHTLSAKKRMCQEYISTLKIEL